MAETNPTKCFFEFCNKPRESSLGTCGNHHKRAQHLGLTPNPVPCITTGCKFFKVYSSSGLCINCNARARRKKNPDHFKLMDKRFYQTKRNDPEKWAQQLANGRKRYPEYYEKYKPAKKKYYTGIGKSGYTARTALRRARQIQQTPRWADLDIIKEFYKNCPKGHEVDHIVPLRGKKVRGFHVIDNLQYLPREENRKKGNKYE